MPSRDRAARAAAEAAASLELAVPRDFGASYGRDVDRGLCLGGGGLFFVAWQVSYLQTLADLGIRFDEADRVVGTSAGSLVGSTLVGRRLKRLHSELSLLSRFPAVVSALVPASTLSPSQQRALDLFIKATDGDPSTVEEIGRAALAAATPRPEFMRRTIALVVGSGRFTSAALQITCVDAYSGERCVVTRDSLTSIPRAVAASSAVPGVFAPQPVGDRRCMDGGVSGTGTHLDLLGGARRVLILALTDGSDMTEGMMTSHPGSGLQELEDLKASGAEVILKVPSDVDLMQLMEPGSVPKALALGASQAKDDAGELAAFWR